jgi:hypothetical protein
MYATVIRYRDWVITAHARQLAMDPAEKLAYTGIAFIEKFELKIDLTQEAASRSLRRKAYYAEGTFEHPSEAKNAAVSAAKIAVDALLD